MADLREFFQIDLRDFLSGRLPIRDLVAFVKSLMRKPGRSTLLMAMDEKTVWTPDLYVLARISDALEASNYLFLKANSDEKADIPMPEPIRRPGEAEEEPPAPKQQEFATGQEVADWFNKMSNL